MLGEVVRVEGPKLLKNGSTMFIIYLVDESVASENAQKLRVSFFVKNEALPPIKEIGDVIMMSGIRVLFYLLVG